MLKVKQGLISTVVIAQNRKFPALHANSARIMPLQTVVSYIGCCKYASTCAYANSNSLRDACESAERRLAWLFGTELRILFSKSHGMRSLSKRGKNGSAFIRRQWKYNHSKSQKYTEKFIRCIDQKFVWLTRKSISDFIRANISVEWSECVFLTAKCMKDSFPSSLGETFYSTV